MFADKQLLNLLTHLETDELLDSHLASRLLAQLLKQLADGSLLLVQDEQLVQQHALLLKVA